MAMFKCSGALFNGTIQINTTAGATVTATTSGTTRTFTAVADAGGLATIRVKKRGVYAIASTGTTHIAHATVSTNTPVTAYYNWSKYNTVHTWGYYQTGEYCLGTYRADLDWSAYNNMSFDTNSGLFSGTGRTGLEPQWYYTGRYTQSSGMVYPESSAPAIYQNTEICQITRYDNWRRGGDDRPYLDVYVIKFVRNSDSYKSKGTYIEEVSSTNLNAYPSGYNSTDGYWYEIA